MDSQSHALPAFINQIIKQLRMKKLLLSLLAVAGISLAATAAEVSFDFVGDGTSDLYGMTRLSGTTSEYNANPTIVTEGAVSIKLTGNTRLWKDGLRFYKSSAMEITAPGYTITDVTFGKNHASFNYDNAALENAIWSGNAESVTFACNISSKNAAVNTLKITIVPKGDANKEDAALSFAEKAFEVELGEAFTAPELVNPNKLAVTYTSSDEAVATVAADGKVTILAAGTTTITAKSEETDKFNAGQASYTITVKAPVATVSSVADTKKLESNTEFKVGYELTVGFVNAKNIFAVDAEGNFIQVYGSNSYKIGDKIPAGWSGKYILYNKVTPEIEPVDALPAATEGTFTPEVVEASAISNDLVNSVVTINNVVLDAATPDKDVTDNNAKNFTGKVGETSLSFRNNYKLASVPAGTYNITCVVMIFNNAPSLYVTNFEEVVNTGIEGVVVDGNEAVEYYNLQGVRVANPENGIYIRRQGNKATKVLVK